MSKNYLNPNCSLPVQQIVCHYSDSSCLCVDAHDKHFIGMEFADICRIFFGIDIPYYIKYAIIRTSDFEIKFREFGSTINFYYKPLN